ncbi:hypothetical protein LTR37_008721 [Vermiconidia calcicola]|uniref:Uncharacterized protein n=1 Tax=Vermiconidia calcicola TaxID=1690605 RepID=A0ACC3N9U7_9PEZI|nr:hypothetical protein LTR37_008721 [Vermiconidia calcicola]
MATLKRTDSKPLKEQPQRSCIACTETDTQLIRPCRTCESDYCVECLVDMFISATIDRTRMPPHCCHLIQIHTIIGHLSTDQAKAYRAKFEEWITPVKTYCPSPTCSAFVSERRVPTIDTATPAAAPTLPSLLQDVVKTVNGSPHARFFRGELPIDQLDGYSAVVKHPMHLDMIQTRLSASRYQSINDLTYDMKLIVSNAREYNGASHPVTMTAENLFHRYLEEISDATARVIELKTLLPAPIMFACPACHIAICSSCKQIEHGDAPCDTSATDHEIAMLATFGYKRCPRCHAGVKKMYGCSHMQCTCGAHWCYYCQKSINECDGSCEERALEDDEDEEDYDSEEEGVIEQRLDQLDEDARGIMRRLDAQGAPQVQITADATAPAVVAPVPAAVPTSAPAAAAPSIPATDNRIVNLDAGGGRHWADGELDFGDEPEEDSYSQVWSCHHNFDTFTAPPSAKFNYGDLDRMECNRCFQQVEAQRSTVKKKRRLVRHPDGLYPKPTIEGRWTVAPNSPATLQGYGYDRLEDIESPVLKVNVQHMQQTYPRVSVQRCMDALARHGYEVGDAIDSLTHDQDQGLVEGQNLSKPALEKAAFECKNCRVLICVNLATGYVPKAKMNVVHPSPRSIMQVANVYFQ